MNNNIHIKSMARASTKALEFIREHCGPKTLASLAFQTETELNLHGSMEAWFEVHHGPTLCGIGTIFAPDHHEAELSIYLASPWRRQGMGRSLVAAMVREAQAWGHQKNLLLALRSEPLAGSFATALGAKVAFSEAALEIQDIHQKKGNEYREMPPKPGSGVVLAKAQTGDIPGLARVLAGAFSEDYESSRNFLEASQKVENRTTYLALDAMGTLVGSISLTDSRTQWSINGLAVDPQFQGRGHGRAIIQEALSLIQKQGGDIHPLKVHLDVNSSNLRAWELYKKMGFVEFAVVDYYELPRS